VILVQWEVQGLLELLGLDNQVSLVLLELRGSKDFQDSRDGLDRLDSLDSLAGLVQQDGLEI
jgi:hypothetical protein